MGSEWFFSTWFIHRDSALPREPDWLREDEESPAVRRQEAANGQSRPPSQGLPPG